VERRYKCHSCGKTFSETSGTPLWIVTLALALLSHGCPLQAIVFAFGIDERTVKAWQTKAGQHARRVQEHLVCSGRRDLGQVQADEMYVRAQVGRLWMVTAMSVFARLFVWGAVAVQRDEHLLARVIGMVRRAARPGQAILFAIDGFKSYVRIILRTFRHPVYTDKRGRPRLVADKDVHIVQVIKRQVAGRARKLIAVERRLVHGCVRAAEQIMLATQTQLGVINTAYIERLQATLRGWLPMAFWRTRCPARSADRVEDALFWTGVLVCRSSHAGCHASHGCRFDRPCVDD